METPLKKRGNSIKKRVETPLKSVETPLKKSGNSIKKRQIKKGKRKLMTSPILKSHKIDEDCFINVMYGLIACCEEKLVKQ